jgi:hypothetical protein
MFPLFSFLPADYYLSSPFFAPFFGFYVFIIKGVLMLLRRLLCVWCVVVRVWWCGACAVGGCACVLVLVVSVCGGCVLQAKQLLSFLLGGGCLLHAAARDVDTGPVSL